MKVTAEPIGDTLSLASQDLHDKVAAPAEYTTPDGAIVPSQEQRDAGDTLTVRLRGDLIASDAELGATVLLSGRETITFHRPQLAKLGLTPAAGGIVTLAGSNTRWKLEEPLPPGSEPVYEQTWKAIRP